MARNISPLPSPAKLREDFPLSDELARKMDDHRKVVEAILTEDDSRLLVIVGPCSVHSPAEALEYARRLRELQDQCPHLFLVMRVYVDKPRTVLGWKGLVYDPALDDSCDLEAGLIASRRLMLSIAKLGVPIATEFVSPFVVPYLADLVSWAVIGARTTESQTHRELAAALPMPIGFKNATDGRTAPAVNAIRAAQETQAFFGIDSETGATAMVQADGNPAPHLVLRGGDRPNYDTVSLQLAIESLAMAGLSSRVVVDCSHGNSGKDHCQQALVLNALLRQQILARTGVLAGLMLESSLEPGKQTIPVDLGDLLPGVSVTDACLGWYETAKLLREAEEVLRCLSLKKAA